VVSFQLGSEGRMMGILLSFLLMLLISLSILKYFNWIIFRYRYRYLREALEFGLPLLPHSISLFILAMADRYLIGLFLEFDDLGIYVLAMQLAAIFGIFFTSFHNAFTPWLYKNLKKNDSTIQKNIVLFTYLYFIFFILLGFLGVLISPYAIELIADPKYFSAKDLMGFLIFSQIFTGFYLMVVGYLLYEKRTKLLSSITIFSALLNILMFFIFISKYGLKGVALASLIAMLVRFILVWFYSNKVHKMPWNFFKYKSSRV
jgi:O-antigen/teichoic acid export membrane protein